MNDISFFCLHPELRASTHAALCLLVLAGFGCNSGSDASASDSDASVGSETDAELPDTSRTDLAGTLGALGAIEPTLSSFAISNSGETLIYLSSQEIGCDLLMKEGGKWLGTLDPTAQVVEIVVRGTPKLDTLSVGKVEVNYAGGGKSSAYEKSAHAGSVTFTHSEANGPVEGVVDATYTNPMANVMGTFHAEFCPGGQQY